MLLMLTRGQGVVRIDEADLELVGSYRWSLQTSGGRYAVTDKWENGTRHRFSMHSLLMGSTFEMQCDHINNDGLDNRRCNLRLATPQQNCWNRRKRAGSSRFRGVCWNKASRKWQAGIRLGPGKIRHLGMYTCEEEAARAYDAAALAERGEFAVLNFATREID